VPPYLSNGRRSGRYWIAGDTMNTLGRSLYVRLHGPQYGPGAAGKWTDPATGEHGDLLDLIARNRDLHRLSEAMDEARSFLALPRPPERIAPAAPVPTGSPEAARRLFRSGRRFPARWPKPICAPVALLGRSTGLPCATTRRSTTAKPKTLRSSCGRYCSPR
jgi:hypothetical protein